MTPYTIAIVLHVLTAVLGIGLVPAIVVVAGVESSNPAAKVAVLQRLAIASSIGLGLMLLTGIAILGATHGAGVDSGWFRTSFVLFIITGAMLGLVRRSLRGALTDPGGFARARRFAGIAAALVLAIVVLMQAKPF